MATWHVDLYFASTHHLIESKTVFYRCLPPSSFTKDLIAYMGVGVWEGVMTSP